MGRYSRPCAFDAGAGVLCPEVDCGRLGLVRPSLARLFGLRRFYGPHRRRPNGHGPAGRPADRQAVESGRRGAVQHRLSIGGGGVRSLQGHGLLPAAPDCGSVVPVGHGPAFGVGPTRGRAPILRNSISGFGPVGGTARGGVGAAGFLPRSVGLGDGSGVGPIDPCGHRGIRAGAAFKSSVQMGFLGQCLVDWRVGGLELVGLAPLRHRGHGVGLGSVCVALQCLQGRSREIVAGRLAFGR